MMEPTLMGEMPPEYLLWVDENYNDMLRFARSRNSGADAVDDAVLRTSHSDAFPVNDMTLWWTWHCGAIRSYISNQARGGARAADLAQEIAGAIRWERGARTAIPGADSQAERHERRTLRTKQPLVVFHSEEEKPEGTILQPAMRGWYHVREIGRCGRCGLPVRWEMEREPYDDSDKPTVIPVAACYGCGRREYNRPAGDRNSLLWEG